MTSCVAKNCFNYTKTVDEIPEEISLHPFPKNDTLRAKWIKQMNDDDFKPDNNSALCSLHFIKEYFDADSNNLKADAIPTEFEFDGMEIVDDTIRCCAYKCTNTYNPDSPITFHPFPTEQPELCDQWLMAMGVTQLAAKQAVLCSQHFDEMCFVEGVNGERLIMADAVPSIFLFPDAEDTPANDESCANEDMPSANDESSAKNELSDAVTLNQTSIELVEKHDDTVNEVIEESRRLTTLYHERMQLEKDKKNIDFLIKTVLNGSVTDKGKVKKLDSVIRNIDTVVQQIVVDCLSPCVALLNDDDEVQE